MTPLLVSNYQPTDLYLVIYLPCLTDQFRQNLKKLNLLIGTGCKAFPKNTGNDRGRKQSGICFDW